jgi:hypothetical protein
MMTPNETKKLIELNKQEAALANVTANTPADVGAVARLRKDIYDAKMDLINAADRRAQRTRPRHDPQTPALA